MAERYRYRRFDYIGNTDGQEGIKVSVGRNWRGKRTSLKDVAAQIEAQITPDLSQKRKEQLLMEGNDILVRLEMRSLFRGISLSFSSLVIPAGLLIAGVSGPVGWGLLGLSSSTIVNEVTRLKKDYTALGINIDQVEGVRLKRIEERAKAEENAKEAKDRGEPVEVYVEPPEPVIRRVRVRPERRARSVVLAESPVAAK